MLEELHVISAKQVFSAKAISHTIAYLKF